MNNTIPQSIHSRKHSLRLTYLFFLALNFSCLITNAQWIRSDNGINGGSIRSFAVMGSNLFAGTDGGGVFVSPNDGAGWTPVNTGLGNLIVNALAVNGSSLFAGTAGGAGVYLSANNGSNWTAANTGLIHNNITSFVVSGANIFAGTSSGGVFLSANNGTSWTAVNTGLTNLSVRALAVSGANIFAGTSGGGVFLSADNGASWTAVNTGLTSLSVNALAVSGANIFAGTSGGIFLSTNNGASWTIVNTGLTNFFVRAIATSGSNVFAGTFGGLFLSTNNGASWAAVNTGLTNLSVQSLATKGTNVFAGTAAGLFLSANNGTTWTVANTGLKDITVTSHLVNGSTHFSGTREGIYGSADNGATWTAMNTGLTDLFVSALARNGATLFAGTNGSVALGGVFVSTNNGASWVVSNTGLTNHVVYSLTTSGSNIVAGTSTGVFISANNGASWTVSTGLPPVTSVRCFMSVGSTLFAGTDAKVYKSTDNGASWTASATGITDLVITALAVTGTTIFASSQGDLYTSTDNGLNWVVSPHTGIPNGRIITDFAVSGTTIFAGTNFGGVFRSTDNGANWTAVSFPGFPGIGSFAYIYNLELSGTTLFAGIQNYGLWSRSLADFTPTISSFTPAAGPEGTTVTITGTGFNASPSHHFNIVMFNGTGATVTAATATSITTTVPAGATTGPVTVDNIIHTATSASNFLVAFPPAISSFTPTSGLPGTTVTITGTNFSATPGNNTVSFNGVPAVVTASTATSITTTVPAGATTGTISVTVNLLTATSSSSFTVPPAISGFSPASGPAGTSVTINGTNFSTTPGSNTVSFNGVNATVTASTTTSITTSVPAGATTGTISVTVGSLTATSSSAFTVIQPPSISGFTPASGLIGSTVTITGANFSATPANNSVSFNGTAAIVTASTTTSITTTVPAGATTGTISVTVNSLTATSASSFTVVIPDTSKPLVTNTTNSAATQGSNMIIMATISDAESGITVANLLYRSIAAGGDFATVAMSNISGQNYTQTINASVAGELGIEYKFDVTNGDGLKNDPALYTVRVSIPGNGLVIPYNSPGNDVANYRIVAVPLALDEKSAGDVFDELGAVNNANWRMSRYQNGANQEMNLSSAIEPGKGYWLIVKEDPGVINSGTGVTVETSTASPFAMDLVAGWNQIGNPYNFNIDWADVQAANSGLPGLRKYVNTFIDATVLGKMEGGFVNVPAARKIVFPVVMNKVVNGGRIAQSSHPDKNPLTAKNWQVYLQLSQGKRHNKIAGFGMHEHASAAYDAFDGLTMPRFFSSWLEVNHVKKYNNALYSKDIVPTSENQVWEFSVESSEDDPAMTFTWDNTYFGENGPALYLWDNTLQQSVDMRAADRYSFNKNQSKSFKVVYGSPAFVKGEMMVTDLMLYDAWPNPAHENDEVTIPFSIPGSAKGERVKIHAVDMLGHVVWQSEASFSEGYHEVKWRRSAREAKGLYIVTLHTGKISKRVRVVLR